MLGKREKCVNVQLGHSSTIRALDEGVGMKECPKATQATRTVYQLRAYYVHGIRERSHRMTKERDEEH